MARGAFEGLTESCVRVLFMSERSGAGRVGERRGERGTGGVPRWFQVMGECIFCRIAEGSPRARGSPDEYAVALEDPYPQAPYTSWSSPESISPTCLKGEATRPSAAT